jgi:AbrB family looped-hinge helix DNA binding protein
MSSKGQVVIPEEIRTALGLGAGSQFIVVGQDDVIVLKAIKPPAMSDFDHIVGRAHELARTAGMTATDVRAAIKVVRTKP